MHNTSLNPIRLRLSGYFGRYTGDKLKKVILICGVALTMLLLTTLVNGEEQQKQSCKEHPEVSGPCFKIRGRMSLYNGTPSVRIWPVGTKRILGVSEGEYYSDEHKNLPDNIGDKLHWGNAIFADFIICPFTEDKPGVMRLVCVESAENVKIVEY